MRQTFSAKTEAGPGDLFDVVADLGTYPNWLDVVSQVERTDDPEAWVVTLRARVGPLARSKRLRMKRITHDRAGAGGVSTVRFERREIDGKNHADWVLSAEVAEVSSADHRSNPGPAAAGQPLRSEVKLDLSYEGPLWSGLLDGVLAAAADRATGKLQAYVKP